MNLLLDTHVLLWWLKNPENLTEQARSAISDSGSLVFYSAANIWEIAIKSALGKLPVISRHQMKDALAADDIRPRPILPAHAWGVSELPRHHGDPFDRILILFPFLSATASCRIPSRHAVDYDYGYDQD